MNALLMLKNPAPIERMGKPPAGRPRLIAFVADGQSEASLSACLSHLPFPSTAIKSGGIVRAIQHLSTERSPESLIVDISGADMPASKMHDVAELCEPGVTVIAIGDRNDIGLYRDLVRAGVSEYIVKPVTPQLLAKALSPKPAADGASLISRKLGKLISFVGARGGVGTTTLAINLARYLADRQNRRTILLDLDLQSGDCAFALNIRPTPGLRDALTNPLRIDNVFLDRAMAVYGERLFVLSAEEPLRADFAFAPEAIETLVGVLRTHFHYIIADVPRIPAAHQWRALDGADIRIIVADQTLRSVRDAVRLRTALDEGNAGQRNLLVVNRGGEGGRHAMTIEEMANVELRPTIVIPFRPKLFTATGLARRRSGLTEAVAALATEISGRMPKRKAWWRFAIS